MSPSLPPSPPRSGIAMRSARRSAGVAAIELALLLVPMVLLTFGMIELGRALYTYNTLLKATRDGARYLSMQARGNGHDVAKCLAVYANTGCSGPPVVPGLATTMVSVHEQIGVPTEAGSIDLVRVQISGYAFSSLIPPLSATTPGTFTFGAVATTMRQASS